MMLMFVVLLLHAELVNADDLTLGFIRVNDLNCLECVELNGGKEFLLCFHSKPYIPFDAHQVHNVL